MEIALINYNKGCALIGSDRHEEAIAILDRALETKPDLYLAWFNRGFSLHNLGQYEKAIKSYDRALAIKPDLCEAWVNHGRCLADLGRDKEAVASHERALALRPDLHIYQSGEKTLLLALFNSFPAVNEIQPTLYRIKVISEFDRSHFRE
jgi:tetratricopeptide (TPR) repeat protein